MTTTAMTTTGMTTTGMTTTGMTRPGMTTTGMTRPGMTTMTMSMTVGPNRLATAIPGWTPTPGSTRKMHATGWA